MGQADAWQNERGRASDRLGGISAGVGFYALLPDCRQRGLSIDEGPQGGAKRLVVGTHESKGFVYAQFRDP